MIETGKSKEVKDNDNHFGSRDSQSDRKCTLRNLQV